VWQIQYTNVAAKALYKLNSEIREEIKYAIENLSQTPDLGKQLAGPLKGLRSLRVGDYRIIYKKENNICIILIIAIGHRKDIYRNP
jgi:mRNA interferase RelE/StbE